MLCFRKVPAAKKFLVKSGRVSKVSVDNILSQMAETFSRGYPLCCVSENFR